MAMNLASHWWVLVLRGVAAVVFGVLALLYPPGAIAALVVLFGAYAIVDGIFNIVAAVRTPRGGERWGWLLFEGIISVVAGLVTLFWPGPTALALVLLIGAWSLVTGIAEIAAAIRLRKTIEGEWLLGLSGVLSIAFGILVFIAPGAGAVAIAIWIGAYAIAFGALLIALGVKLRSWASHQPVTGAAVPQPA
jgi:uncharacterized membrane protein HdeD (DUF308 family)